MEKIMSLELLSSIKGAGQSDAINQLFRVIGKAFPENENTGIQNEFDDNVILLENLRNDEIVECDERSRELIVGNFPKEKNGFLVVSRVIEF
jgi:Asp-tRNA(Asn)/Glu-tRNA(Gln) amidotransferase C subunit